MNSVKILGNRLHVRNLPKRTKTEGGIILDERFNDDNKTFEVLGVGTGAKVRVGKKGNRRWETRPLEIKPGDKVLAECYGDHTILPDGSKIINADWVLAVW